MSIFLSNVYQRAGSVSAPVFFVDPETTSTDSNGVRWFVGNGTTAQQANIYADMIWNGGGGNTYWRLVANDSTVPLLVKVDGGVNIGRGLQTDSNNTTNYGDGVLLYTGNGTTQAQHWFRLRNVYNSNYPYLQITNASNGNETFNVYNEGSAKVGNWLGVGVFPTAPLHVVNQNGLGGTAGNLLPLTTAMGYTGNGTFRKTCLRRMAAGADWQTVRHHDWLDVDNVYSTPGTNTRCWYERDINAGSHHWGDSASQAAILLANGTFASVMGSTVRLVSQTAHGFSVGNVLKYTGSAYALAQANSAANAEVVGIVCGTSGANAFYLLSGGYVAGLSGLSAGTTYFLSPTVAGTLTATEPTTNGQVSLPLLVAESTTTGFFQKYRGEVIGPATPVPLPISLGGTGETTAANAINALLPTQTGQSGKYLTTSGTAASWGAINASTITTGYLPPNNGGVPPGVFTGGRLTTELGVSVSVSDRTSQPVLYYVAHSGGYLSLWSGSQWQSVSIYNGGWPSLSLASTAANTNYDVYGVLSGGAVTLQLVAWSGATTRATTPILDSTGVWVHPSFLTYRYLGTIRSTFAGYTSDAAYQRFVWNQYNPVPRMFRKTDTSSTHTGYGNSAWTYWFNNTANKVEWVTGGQHYPLELMFSARAYCGLATGNNFAQFGIAVDGTSPQAYRYCTNYSQAYDVNAEVRFTTVPAPGYHYAAAVELTVVGVGGNVYICGENAGSTGHGLWGHVWG